MEPTVLLVAAALAATAAALGGAMVRVVPAGHCGVVTRGGRVVRSRPPGLTLVAPGAERIDMVALYPPPIDPFGVAALTGDGVEVRLTVSVLWRVADPSRVIQSVPEARAMAEAAVERGLHHLVATVELAHLLRDLEPVLARLPARTRHLVAPFGVELVDVVLLGAEVRVGPDLLCLLA